MKVMKKEKYEVIANREGALAVQEHPLLVPGEEAKRVRNASKMEAFMLGTALSVLLFIVVSLSTTVLLNSPLPSVAAPVMILFFDLFTVPVLFHPLHQRKVKEKSLTYLFATDSTATGKRKELYSLVSTYLAKEDDLSVDYTDSVGWHVASPKLDALLAAPIEAWKKEEAEEEARKEEARNLALSNRYAQDEVAIKRTYRSTPLPTVVEG